MCFHADTAIAAASIKLKQVTTPLKVASRLAPVKFSAVDVLGTALFRLLVRTEAKTSCQRSPLVSFKATQGPTNRLEVACKIGHPGRNERKAMPRKDAARDTATQPWLTRAKLRKTSASAMGDSIARAVAMKRNKPL